MIYKLYFGKLCRSSQFNSAVKKFFLYIKHDRYYYSSIYLCSYLNFENQ